MVQQSKKQCRNESASATWNGQSCDVIREQDILTACNEKKACCVIRIHGLELWKALRLVAADEVRNATDNA